MNSYPAWDKANSYNKLDIVDFHGDLFCAVRDVPEDKEISDTSYWLMIEANGTKTNHEKYQMLLIDSLGEGSSPDLSQLLTRMQTAENSIQSINSNLATFANDLDAAEGAIDDLEAWQQNKSGGDYVVNGGGDFNWDKFSRSAFISRSVRNNSTEAIRIWGQYTKESDGYNLDGLVFSNKNQTIFHQRYNADTSTWVTVATYKGEEDTGWQTMTGDYLDVYYRKKNGVLYLKCAQPLKQDLNGQQGVVLTLPEGFRPNQVTYLFYSTADGTKSIRFYISTNGNIDFRPSEAITAGTQIQGLYAIPL